jgi:hypothetical protein
MQAIEDSSQQLIGTDDPKEHRRIYQELTKTLGDIDTAKTGSQAGGATSGKTYSQADIDAAARQYGRPPQEIEQAFQAKGWSKK